MREDQFRVRARVLAEASDAQEIAGRLDLIDLSAKLGMSIPEVREIVETLDALGLLISGLNEGEEPLVLRAGRQYLELRGEIDDATLAFLAETIDDVHARAAVLRAGTELVRDLRRSLLDSRAVEHAREIVPPAFAGVVDKQLSLDLYSAAVALMTRLSHGRPPGCLAEEIVTVRVVESARENLERRPAEELDPSTRAQSVAELRLLIGLFHDDTVLELFELDEPRSGTGVETWFGPFDSTAPPSYLGALGW
jgi:hypothetical protein